MNIDPPEWSKWPVGWFIGGLLQLVGGWDVPLQLLLLAQIFNHFFGISAAIKTGEGFQPKKLAGGIFTSLCYWIAIAVAVSIDQYFVYLGQVWPISLHEAIVLGFFTADTVSSVTNMALCGVPVPKVFMESVAKLKHLANDVVPGGKDA